MQLDREDVILNIRQAGYIDTQINQQQSEEARAISLRNLEGRYPDAKPEEISAEYQNGVNERLAQVASQQTVATVTKPDQAIVENWLRQESGRIHEAAEIAVPVAELDQATAYWNGRRESYNSARDFAIESNPDSAKDLPEAIQIDQVRVRALQVEQEVAMSASR